MSDLASTDEAMLEVDRVRDQDPATAIERYLSVPPAPLIRDPERVSWLLENVGPIPPATAIPFLDHVIDKSSDLPLRLALHLRAVVRWYRGDTGLAEEDWRRTLEESRLTKDRTWIRAHNNLALCLSTRGAYFEALVLFGGAARLAEEMERATSLVFAHCRRGQMFALLGEADRAEAALELATRQWEQLEDGEERRFMASILWASRARLAWAQRDWRGVLEAQERRIEELGDLPPEQHPTLANAHTLRLRALSELKPERRQEWLEELARLPERFEINARWESEWEREHAALRFRTALMDQGETPDAVPSTLVELGGAWLDRLEVSMHGNELIDEAVEIARIFRKAGLDELSRRAFDLAATETLHRLVEAHAASKDLPELAEATAEDWAVLSAHRERLVAHQEELLATVARFWQPGHPAFELVVVDEMVRLCAWCQRVRMRDASWIPVAGYLPADSAVRVSHAICDECSNTFFG